MIELQDVYKNYGLKKAVSNMTFKIDDGEIVGLIGPNGAGKTTTMNMITGYIEPTGGKIIVNGYDIEKKPKMSKKQIGYMPEDVPLYYDMTVKEFVCFMADLRLLKKAEKREEVERVLKATNIKDVENKLIRNISRGYKQRVSLAGALVGNPKILILDEPTVGLDPKQVTEIRELIKSLRKDHTVIISSHILSEISQICDRIIVLNNGKILKIGKISEIEDQTSNNIIIEISVEDEKNNFEYVIKNISEIINFKLIKKEKDNKIYELECNEDKNINKKIFKECAAKDIVITEMKKKENSLEDAFLKIINEGGNK